MASIGLKVVKVVIEDGFFAELQNLLFSADQQEPNNF
jgi:hypothetical protein